MNVPSQKPDKCFMDTVHNEGVSKRMMLSFFNDESVATASFVNSLYIL